MPKFAKLSYEPHDVARFTQFEGKTDDERSDFEVDRSRIVHSAAFRRLQGKTQVFGVAQDAFFRTRLTHSLEVAQIAKGIALRVGADAELCEAAALAHDIGHPPFGHQGEKVLAALMKNVGGFEANAQNLRLLAKLEIKYNDDGIRGLNLTRGVLDAILKYRTPFRKDRNKFYYIDDPVVKEVTEWAMDGQREQPLECQIMDWADDIAYSVHDLEDGVHAGMITVERILNRSGSILARAQRQQPKCDQADLSWALGYVTRCEDPGDERQKMAVRKEVTSELINQFVQVRTRAMDPNERRRARHGSRLVVSPSLRRKCEVLKSLAYQLMIDDPRVASLEERAETILTGLFNKYTLQEARRIYPEPFRVWFDNASSMDERARVACDFISGMTDEYAERVYSRMFTPFRAALGDY